MVDTTILERILLAYLNIFTFGYSQTIGQALWLLRTFMTVELTVMGLYLMVSDDNLLVVSMSKLFLFGTLSWLLLSWPELTEMMQQSFIRWGIVAGGGVITVEDFRAPGNLFAFGAQIGVLLLQHLRTFTGWNVVFNGVEVALTGVLTLFILAAFAWMTIQVAIAMLEYYLGATLALLLLPFGAFRWLSFLAEKTLGYVLGLGIKLAVLAFVISMAQFSFQFMQLARVPRLEQTIGLAVAVGFVLVLTIKAPSWVHGLLAGVPSLSAGAVINTAISMGAAAGGVATAAASGAGTILRGTQRGIQGVRALHHAAATGGVAGVASFGAVSARDFAARTAHRFLHPGPQQRAGASFRSLIPHE
jgi:type IV secretion system protein TrbL